MQSLPSDRAVRVLQPAILARARPCSFWPLEDPSMSSDLSIVYDSSEADRVAPALKQSDVLERQCIVSSELSNKADIRTNGRLTVGLAAAPPQPLAFPNPGGTLPLSTPQVVISTGSTVKLGGGTTIACAKNPVNPKPAHLVSPSGKVVEVRWCVVVCDMFCLRVVKVHCCLLPQLLQKVIWMHLP